MTDPNKKEDNVGRMLDNIQPRMMDIAKGTTDQAQVIVVPVGMRLESAKHFLDQYKTKPDRRTGTEQADRLVSFIDLVNRFKSADSAIFAKGEITGSKLLASLTAILDYHAIGADNKAASYKAHRVSYKFPISKEFEFWFKHNGELMDQEGFALMLEERINEMVSASEEERNAIANLTPKFADPLEILKLSRDLVVYSSEKLQQSTKLSSGERTVKFTAEHADADGKPLSIPDFFVLNIPVFAGEAATRVLVRMRYRKAGEKVLWAYDIYRVDMVFEAAFDAAVDKVKKETEVALFMGESGPALQSEDDGY